MGVKIEEEYKKMKVKRCSKKDVGGIRSDVIIHSNRKYNASCINQVEEWFDTS